MSFLRTSDLCSFHLRILSPFLHKTLHVEIVDILANDDVGNHPRSVGIAPTVGLWTSDPRGFHLRIPSPFLRETPHVEIADVLANDGSTADGPRKLSTR